MQRTKVRAGFQLHTHMQNNICIYLCMLCTCLCVCVCIWDVCVYTHLGQIVQWKSIALKGYIICTGSSRISHGMILAQIHFYRSTQYDPPSNEDKVSRITHPLSTFFFLKKSKFLCIIEYQLCKCGWSEVWSCECPDSVSQLEQNTIHLEAYIPEWRKLLSTSHSQ